MTEFTVPHLPFITFLLIHLLIYAHMKVTNG